MFATTRNLLLALFLVALGATTAPASEVIRITSVKPSVAMSAGGDAITIDLEAITTFPCMSCTTPPSSITVTFGGVKSPEVRVIDGDTLVAVAPPHAAAQNVDVVVTFEDSHLSATSAGAFTYVDDLLVSSFDIFLVPLPIINASAPLPGANGSKWATEFFVHHGGHVAVSVFPADLLHCVFGICEPPIPLGSIDPGQTSAIVPQQSKQPWYLYVQNSQSAFFSTQLRVRDVSRSTQNSGTEIPVVRVAELNDAPIHLLDVPVDSTSRAALRLFVTHTPAFGAPTAQVTARHMLLPSFSRSTTMTLSKETLFNNGFPAAPGTYSIDDLGRALDLPEGRYEITVTPSYTGWAYAAVTNNETQLVTAIAANTGR